MTSRASILAKTWVAVLDGGRASAFENDGFDDAPNLRFVFGAENDNPPSRAQSDDRPGRFDTPMGGHTAASAIDKHDQKEARFIDAFFHDLEKAARAGRFDRLVLIAPAKAMRRLRAAAPTAVGKVVGSHAADLAHAPMAKIERAFQAALKG